MPNFTWQRDYWLDHSLLLWTLLFLHQVASVSPLLLLFSTQLCESLCVPDDGEHLGNWLLAGSVSLLFNPLFYPPGYLCLLPPSPLPCITPWTSLSGPDCGAHIRKWLLASLLSPLLIPLHLIPVTSNYPLPLLFSMYLSEPLWVSLTVENFLTINLDVLSSMLYGWGSLGATIRIRLKARGRRLKSKIWGHQSTPGSREH